MSVCPSCSTQQAEGIRFCTNCGKPLPAAAAQAGAYSAAPAQAPPPPPAPSQPQYQAPPAPPPAAAAPAPNSSFYIVLALAAVAAWYFFFQGVSPEALINKYLDGIQNGNLAMVRETLSAASLKKFNDSDPDATFKQMKQLLGDFKFVNRKITKKSEDANAATYTVKFTIQATVDGKPQSEDEEKDLNMVKEGGKWKLALDNI